MFDPFQQLCYTPFEEDSSAASSSSDDAGAADHETASPANSIESFHDEGLISSCDEHAVEFLLYALALQDQVPSQPQPRSREAQQATGVACPLARTAAGALDAMLLQDCASTGTTRQHVAVKKTSKEPAEHKVQEPADSEQQH